MKAQELILKCAADLNEAGKWDLSQSDPNDLDAAWEAFAEEFDMDDLLDIPMVVEANKAVYLAYKSRDESDDKRSLFVETSEQAIMISRMQMRMLFFKKLQDALDRYAGDDEQKDWIDQDNKERLRGFNS